MTLTIENLDQLVEDCSKHAYDSTLPDRLNQAAVMHREKLLESFHSNEQYHQGSIVILEDQSESATTLTTICTKKNTYTTLEEEIEGTLGKIQIAPNDVTNFLSVAKLYSCQGNSQEAIHICEQGLENTRNMASSSTTDLLLLQQQLDMMKAQSERRVDFLSQCPHEVGCNIINYLDSAAAIQGIDVSRAWRYKFLDHPHVWKEFTLDGTGKQRKITQLLGIKSKCMETLLIRGWPDKIKRHLTVSIKKNDFSNLRSLVITDTGDGNIDPGVNISQSMYNTMSCISNTLTRLDLVSQSAVSLSLGRILLACQHLKRLKLGIYSFDESFSDNQSLRIASGSDFSDFTTSSLTHLEIWATSPIAPRVIREIMRETVEFTPELRQLVVAYQAREHSDMEDMLQAIGNNCPKLKVLKTSLISRSSLDLYDGIFNVENQEDGDDEEETITTTAEEPDDGPSTTTRASTFRSSTAGTTTVTETITAPITKKPLQGIRHLDIHNLVTTEFLRTRLEASCHTLETLSLQLGVPGLARIFPEHWQTSLSIFTMYRLTTFRFSRLSLYVYPGLAAILYCFPALETLILEHSPVINDGGNDMTVENNRLLNAIIQLPNLKRIELDSMYTLDTMFFEQLMHHYHIASTTATSKCNLKILKITNCKGLSYKALLLIPRIASLEELSVRNPNHQGIGSNMFIEMFTNHLIYDSSRPRALSSLELVDMKFTRAAIQNMISLGKRKEILQKKLLLKYISGCTNEDTKLLKKELAPLYHDSDYSEFCILPEYIANTRRTFIFSEKKLTGLRCSGFLVQ
ncbi:hypothetical protein BDA99DRAFT_533379 [Phascolomyces articulosus]|uniref:F-box domain-containing protein n=1 Tax=Phascolomyces articulosus TaxID=60185 RepID=A0AAD5KLR0_9FUNG|nr:hypothetical protein BDA99DRAFT_533379 [Phascolomyces articulosus]